MATLGSRIKAARLDKGLTQGELASACGWGEDVIEGQSRISNYERDKREPTLSDLRIIAKKLGVDAAELIFGHPLEPDPDEDNILHVYRTADARGKQYILGAVAAVKPERRKGHKRKRSS